MTLERTRSYNEPYESERIESNIETRLANKSYVFLVSADRSDVSTAKYACAESVSIAIQDETRRVMPHTERLPQEVGLS